MNRSETAELLARVVAFDRRTLGESDVMAWHEVLSDIHLADAIQAVVEHFKISKEWLMPADVRTGSKKIRGRRLQIVDFAPDADPDDVPAYLEALRSQRFRVASGEMNVRDMRAIERTFKRVDSA